MKDSVDADESTLDADEPPNNNNSSETAEKDIRNCPMVAVKSEQIGDLSDSHFTIKVPSSSIAIKCESIEEDASTMEIRENPYESAPIGVTSSDQCRNCSKEGVKVNAWGQCKNCHWAWRYKRRVNGIGKEPVTCPDCQQKKPMFVGGVCRHCYWKKLGQRRRVARCEGCSKEKQILSGNKCANCYSATKRRVDECSECGRTRRIVCTGRCGSCYVKHRSKSRRTRTRSGRSGTKNAKTCEKCGEGWPVSRNLCKKCYAGDRYKRVKAGLIEVKVTIAECEHCKETKEILAMNKCRPCYVRCRYEKRFGKTRKRREIQTGPCVECASNDPIYARHKCEGCYKNWYREQRRAKLRKQKKPAIAECLDCKNLGEIWIWARCKPCYDQFAERRKSGIKETECRIEQPCTQCGQASKGGSRAMCTECYGRWYREEKQPTGKKPSVIMGRCRDCGEEEIRVWKWGRCYSCFKAHQEERKSNPNALSKPAPKPKPPKRRTKIELQLDHPISSAELLNNMLSSAFANQSQDEFGNSLEDTKHEVPTTSSNDLKKIRPKIEASTSEASTPMDVSVPARPKRSRKSTQHAASTKNPMSECVMDSGQMEDATASTVPNNLTPTTETTGSRRSAAFKNTRPSRAIATKTSPAASNAKVKQEYVTYVSSGSEDESYN